LISEGRAASDATAGPSVLKSPPRTFGNGSP
jgi:hypothetical protein